MEDLKEYKEKLGKIEANCRNCHAKMCNICPNNKIKTKLRKEIEKFEGSSEKKSFLKKLKEFFN